MTRDMAAWRRAWALGLATALIGIAACSLPVIQAWEADLGLGLLFKLRGVRAAPSDTVIIGIDRESSRAFRVPNRPDRWPRLLHARLVERLAAAGARVIAFDVLFREPRDPANDRALASAVAQAGNVLLIEDLIKERGTGKGGRPAAIEHRIQTVTLPYPALAAGALATAPFPLPKVPAKLSQFWLFSPEEGSRGRDKACLPTLTLFAYAQPHLGDLLSLVSEWAREAGLPARLTGPVSLAERSARLRRLMRAHPELVDRLHARVAGLPGPEARATLGALVSAYGGEASAAINFYGPPRTLTSLSYHDALGVDSELTEAGLRALVRDKAVFVGFSEWVQMEQEDYFYTPYSQDDGRELSGVEIAATVFSNLRDGSTLRLPDTTSRLSLIALFGLVLGLVARRLVPTLMVPIATAVVLLYVAGVYQAFSRHQVWLPLFIPLLVQSPLAIGTGLMWGFRDARREREHMQKTMGYYLPPAVVAELCRAAGGPPTASRDAYAVCLFSDAERYTSLAEGLSPGALHGLLNRYYGALFEPVRRHGGLVSDVVGDAMLALWATAGPDPGTRAAACRAAIEIMAEIGVPGASDAYLPTRIGLHCGEVALGNVGAGEHFEYRAVGDIVNTAQRIEDLNKRLGTRVLVSDEVLVGLKLDQVLTREIGRFRLSGKTRPLTLHQLWLPGGEGPERCERRRMVFAAGLVAFRLQDFGQAARIFEGLLDALGEDGPSRFYLALCGRYQRAAPAGPWDGTVNLDEVPDRPATGTARAG